MGNWTGRGWALGSVLAVVGLIGGWPPEPGPSEVGEGLLVYCAAGIQPAMAEAAAAFQQQPFGVPVQLQFGGSGTLLVNLRMAQPGDIFVAADESYLDLARQLGLVGDSWGLARMHPVLAVAQGNPRRIRGLHDLARPDVRVGLAQPEAASIGKLTRDLLRRAGLWDQVEAHVTVMKPTVSDVANDVMMGALDATVIWDVVVAQHDDRLDGVTIPMFEEAVQQVSLGILRGSQQPALALRFVRYLQSDAGQSIFRRHHYEPVFRIPEADTRRTQFRETP